jgi:hypothetical protein
LFQVSDISSFKVSAFYISGTGGTNSVLGSMRCVERDFFSLFLSVTGWNKWSSEKESFGL